MNIGKNMAKIRVVDSHCDQLIPMYVIPAITTISPPRKRKTCEMDIFFNFLPCFLRLFIKYIMAQTKRILGKTLKITTKISKPKLMMEDINAPDI